MRCASLGLRMKLKKPSFMSNEENTAIILICQYIIAHERGFKLHAQSQTGAYSC